MTLGLSALKGENKLRSRLCEDESMGVSSCSKGQRRDVGEEGELVKAGTEDGPCRDDDCDVESFTGDSGVSSGRSEALGAILTVWPAAFRAVHFPNNASGWSPQPEVHSDSREMALMHPSKSERYQ